ncbi:putative oxidoreductase [Pseudoxanthomonas japonensis]|jgi:putative oxidoreductase|uniref:DoxX family protein n=1 Tax=Pseudoxanthomonas TaxID=83618 RepID=UPI0007854F50|nr:MULTISPECIES: DoxX family protein [Pseudoxanthomonas]MBA3929658.1 DoxX family protein [Xanthomonas sp.]MDR7069244.1 putative oxidoreductase [Pseudoxanthomonas japonensis]
MSTVTATRTPALRGAADLVGRTLLASLFIISGLGKLAAYAGTAGYMASVGVPGALLPLVIALEVVGGLAIIAGYRTRIVASLLALFSIASAVLFHSALGDQIQQIMFLKNIAIAGGFILLAARGAGGWSVDQR